MKLQIKNEQLINEIKRLEIKDKYRNVMKYNQEEFEKRKSIEKTRILSLKLNEREKIENEVNSDVIEQKMKYLDKRKSFLEAEKLSESNKEMQRIKKLKLNQQEYDQTSKEISSLMKKDDEEQKYRRFKYIEMKDIVTSTIKKQIKDKIDHKILEKDKKNYSESNELRNLERINELEKGKLIKKKIYLSKFKDDWDEQILNKAPNREMDENEKQLNKGILKKINLIN